MKHSDRIIEAAEQASRNFNIESGYGNYINFAYAFGVLKARVDELCYEINQFYTAPRAPSDMHEVEVGKFIVHYSVDEDGDALIEYVYVNGANLDIEDLSDSLQLAMKYAIDRDIESIRDAAAYDRGQDLYEARMAA